MKASRLLLSLSVMFASGIASASHPASAGEPGDYAPPRASVGSEPRVSKWVEAALLEPLAHREAARSRYSRVRMPPAARQVRLLDGGPETDRRGRMFVRFAVDERRSAAWERNAMAGCVYLDDGAVFVKRGERVHSAAQYLGKEGPRATSECTAATLVSKR